MTGPALLLAGIALFTALDANSKLLSGSYGVAQVVTLRHVAILTLIALAALLGHGGRVRTRRPLLHAARAVCMVVSSGAFFMGMRQLPLAQGYLVFFTAPLLTLALAALLLRERVPRAAWTWCGVGLGGVLLAVAPRLGQAGALAGFAWVLLGTLGFALTQTLNRRLRDEAGIARILLWPSLLGLLVYAPFAVTEWAAPAPGEWARLLANGVFAGAATVCTAAAYRHADAARLGPFNYAALPMSVVLDIAIWGAWPDAFTLGGGAVVVLACAMSERARLQGMSGGKTWAPPASSGSATTARTAGSGNAP